jgi:hypothetical protein
MNWWFGLAGWSIATFVASLWALGQDAKGK